MRPDLDDTYVGRVFLCVRSYAYVNILTGKELVVWVVEPPIRGYEGINDEVLFPIDPLKDDEPKELVAPLPKEKIHAT